MRKCSVFLFASLCVPAAFADLVQSNPPEINLSGTGFGNVSTIITLQTANGQSTTESGCIGAGGSTTNCGIATDGKIKNSSSLEPVPTGVTSASNLRFVFNASQPAGGSISLNQFEVSFYGNSGSSLFTATLPSPLKLTSTFAGTGNSGFVFQIAPNELAAANAAFGSTTEIGAGFAASGASGGQDTVFLTSASGSSGPGIPPSSVPEPASLTLLGAGLASVFVIRKKFAVR
jgi:hypothetical protein